MFLIFTFFIFSIQFKFVNKIKLPPKEIPAPFTLSSNGNYIIFSNGETIKIWNIKRDRESISYRVEGETIRFLTFSPNEELFILVDKKVEIFRFKDLKKIKTLNLQFTPLILSFSPDGKYFAIAGNGVIQIFDAAKLIELKRLFFDAKEISSLSFSSNGKYLAAANFLGEFKIWNIENGTEDTIILRKIGKKSYCLIFSPKGNYLATTSKRRNVELWDYYLLKRVAIFNHPKDVLFDFHPSGEYIFIANWRCFRAPFLKTEISVWRICDSQLMLRQKFFDVIKFCFSKNGNIVAFLKEKEIEIYKLD